MITIQEIAEIADVSRGTVDRVINQRGKVRKDIEERILSIMKETGYEQKQRRKKIKIGVVTQLYTASFMREIQKGLDRANVEFEDRGLTLSIKHADDVDEVKQFALIEELEQEGIDGLAIMPVDHEIIVNKINALVDKGIPVVTFNSDIVGTKRSCFIGMNNAQSGKAAAGLMALLTRGVGKILIITGYFTNRANSMRVESFVSEMQKFPKIELLGVQCCYDRANMVDQIISKTLDDHNDLLGIFLSSAGQEGIHTALNKKHIRKRPYVIAYDVTEHNIKRLKRGDFDFLIDQESHLQGYLAIKTLFECIQKKQKPMTTEIYTTIQLKTKGTIER